MPEARRPSRPWSRHRRAEPRPARRPSRGPFRIGLDRRARRRGRLCLDAGADDVGFVAIGRPDLDDQRADILRPLPAGPRRSSASSAG